MPIINLTEVASQKVQQLMERDGRDGFALRLKVVGGGCSGLQYQLNGNDAMTSSETPGISVFI